MSLLIKGVSSFQGRQVTHYLYCTHTWKRKKSGMEGKKGRSREEKEGRGMEGREQEEGGARERWR